MSAEGCDLSHHNTSVPQGLDFYIHKCTEGDSFVDEDYGARRTVVRNMGKVWGAYHFFRMSDTAEKQASHFIANAAIGPGDIVALDFEDVSYDPWSKYSNKQIADKGTDVMNILRGAYPGNRLVLYCNESTYRNIVKAYNVPTGDGMWIADLDERPDYAPWVFWQYSWTPYDKNHSVFADAAALRAWCGDWNSFVAPTSSEADEMVLLNAGKDAHETLVVAGKSRLVLGTGYNDDAVVHQIDFWGSNASGWNDKAVGVGGGTGEFRLNPNMPLYLPVPKGAVICVVRYTSNHAIGAGAV